MDKKRQKLILEFLKNSFDPEGTIHFLAVAAMEQEGVEHLESLIIKVRVALTLQRRSIHKPIF